MSKILRFIGGLSIIAIMFAIPSNFSVSAKTSNDFSSQVNISQVKSETINIMEDNPLPGLEIKDISREEYVKNVALDEGISYKKADLLVAERTAKSLKFLQNERGIQSVSPQDVSWRQASWVQGYSGNSSFAAELHGSFEVYSSGSFRQINSATVGSSLATGLNTASWEQGNSWKTTQYPVAEATIGVTGKFYSTVTNTGGADVGIPGFTVSGSTSTEITYVSQAMNIERTYSVY